MGKIPARIAEEIKFAILTSIKIFVGVVNLSGFNFLGAHAHIHVLSKPLEGDRERQRWSLPVAAAAVSSATTMEP